MFSTSNNNSDGILTYFLYVFCAFRFKVNSELMNEYLKKKSILICELQNVKKNVPNAFYLKIKIIFPKVLV